MAPKLMKMIRVEAPILREIMAEFLGTFILVVSNFLSYSLHLAQTIERKRSNERHQRLMVDLIYVMFHIHYGHYLWFSESIVLTQTF